MLKVNKRKRGGREGRKEGGREGSRWKDEEMERERKTETDILGERGKCDVTE